LRVQNQQVGAFDETDDLVVFGLSERQCFRLGRAAAIGLAAHAVKGSVSGR
jgi:hypothetical protein